MSDRPKTVYINGLPHPYWVLDDAGITPDPEPDDTTSDDADAKKTPR